MIVRFSGVSWRRSPPRLSSLLAILAMLAGGCRASAGGNTADTAAEPTAAVAVTTAPATERPIRRFIAVTGTLTAQEQADVAAEIAGRVVATPVERGTRVTAGAVLVRIAEAEVGAQAQEAEANARQIEARLAIADGGEFRIDRVPEVASARSAAELAQADFERAQMLLGANTRPPVIPPNSNISRSSRRGPGWSSLVRRLPTRSYRRRSKGSSSSASSRLAIT